MATLPLLVALCLGMGAAPAPKEIPFEKLIAGPHYLRETQPENVVIRSKAEEDAFVAGHLFAGTPAFPTVDYGKKMVVGVILGPQSTGAIRVNITCIEAYPDHLKVYSVRSLPKPGVFVTEDIGYPVALVQVPKSAKKIVFCPTQDEVRQ